MVKQKLIKKGIEIRSRYKYPLYKQKVFQKLNLNGSQNYKTLFLPNAEKLSGRILVSKPLKIERKRNELHYKYN